MRRARRHHVLIALALGLPACQGSLGRPVPPSEAGPDRESRESSDHGQPGVPSTAAARHAFFMGLGDVETPLARIRAGAAPARVQPRLFRLPDVEAAVRRRHPRGTPSGALRDLMVVGVSGRSTLPPAAFADLMEDPEAQRKALGANRFAPIRTVLDTDSACRRAYRIEILGVGGGPFKVDLRFTAALERWDFPDGHVLLRYDPQPDPAEHVTLFRGFCVIEPDPAGSLYTEMLIVGTDLRVPFFLRSSLRKKSLQTFETRAERIWATANRR